MIYISKVQARCCAKDRSPESAANDCADAATSGTVGSSIRLYTFFLDPRSRFMHLFLLFLIHTALFHLLSHARALSLSLFCVYTLVAH